MFQLHPHPDLDRTCPYDPQVRLKPQGWYMPGMRVLADLKCDRCGREYYADMLTGHGLCFPMLLDKVSGTVHDDYQMRWFADWLEASYRTRKTAPLPFTVEEFRPLKKPLLLNCLDALYGHALLKLLDAQHYLDHYPSFDLIIVVPRFLRWLVPKDVAAIWTVDLPLKRGAEWNDWLAQEVQQRIAELNQCWLAATYAHPYEFKIEQFTQVRPFSLEEWDARLERPTVTFIWREDRLWTTKKLPSVPGIQQWLDRIDRKLGWTRKQQIRQQRQNVIELAHHLRDILPNLEFTVAGIGAPGGLPEWIQDLRTLNIDDTIERAWCEQYARSHVVVGIHGSNMLLPAAHAGAVIELMPHDRWSNVMQDLLTIPTQGGKEALFRYRFTPLETSPALVARMMTSLIQNLSFAMLYLKPASHPPYTIEPRSVAAQYHQVRLQKLSRLGLA